MQCGLYSLVRFHCELGELGPIKLLKMFLIILHFQLIYQRQIIRMLGFWDCLQDVHCVVMQSHYQSCCLFLVVLLVQLSLISSPKPFLSSCSLLAHLFWCLHSLSSSMLLITSRNCFCRFFFTFCIGILRRFFETLVFFLHFRLF